MIDTGRSAVYDGEHAVRGLLDAANTEGASRQVTVGGVTLVLPVERKFASIASVQAYCDQVCSHLGVTTVKVRSRRGDKFAHYTQGEIAVPDATCGWAMREIVVLHELAHHLTLGSGAAHGPEFRAAFLVLLTEYMAPEVALALRLSWWQGGVV